MNNKLTIVFFSIIEIRQAAKTIEISNITDPILDEYVLQTKLSGNDGKRKKVQI